MRGRGCVGERSKTIAGGVYRAVRVVCVCACVCVCVCVCVRVRVFCECNWISVCVTESVGMCN